MGLAIQRGGQSRPGCGELARGVADARASAGPYNDPCIWYRKCLVIRGADLTYGHIMVPASSLLARWGKVLERDRCIGCHPCTTAARARTRSRSGWRTYVKSVDIAVLLQARRVF